MSEVRYIRSAVANYNDNNDGFVDGCCRALAAEFPAPTFAVTREGGRGRIWVFYCEDDEAPNLEMLRKFCRAYQLGSQR